MTTREKIVLGLCGATTVGLCLFYALGSSDNPDPSTSERDIASLVLKAKEGLAESELTDRETRVLYLAARQSLRDPFRSKPLQFTRDEPKAELPLPSYTGFIDTGPEPIAIIDGLDYRPGELVSGGEFEVSGIAADHIRLLRRGAGVTFSVPIEKLQAP